MSKKEQKIYILILSFISIFFISKLSGMHILDMFKFLLIVVFLIVVLLVSYFTSKEKEVHNKFFIIALFVGMILIAINPILHGIDEDAHFLKVYSIFNKVETFKDEEKGVFYKTPENIVKASQLSGYLEEIELANEKIDNNKYIFSNRYLGINLYSPLAYITYILPMYISLKLNFGIIPTVLFGRIFSFLIWLILSTYTIKIMPKKKEFIAFLCLMPITLTLVTTYTGDLITNTSILLFIAYWYRLYYEKRPIKFYEVIVINILGILSVCSKIIYALIFLLILFLPNENFKSKKHKIFVNSLILFSLILTAIINLSMVGNDLLEVYPVIKEQKEWIFNHVFSYIIIIIRTMIYFITDYIYQFTTGHTTMLQNTVYVSEIISLAYVFILICSLYIDEVKNNFSKKFKISVFIIAFIIIFTIFTSLYLQWTAVEWGVGNDLIWGVQGRYFFPVVALFALINSRENKEINKNYLWNGVIIINYIILLQILLIF